MLRSTVAGLMNKLPAFFLTRRSVNRLHSSRLLEHVLSRISPVHTHTSYLHYILFNIIIPYSPESSSDIVRTDIFFGLSVVLLACRQLIQNSCILCHEMRKDRGTTGIYNAIFYSRNMQGGTGRTPVTRKYVRYSSAFDKYRRILSQYTCFYGI